MAAGTVERFADAGGLFKVRLDILGATPAARQGGAVFPHPRPEHARAWLSRGQGAGRALRRYCSGCARETEHVPWSSHGPAHLASIRWPVAEPAGGTTICQDCGQVRVAATRPTVPAWSSWPKTACREAERQADRAGVGSAVRRGSLRGRPENEWIPPRPESPSQAKASSCAHGLTSAAARLRRRAPSFGARAEQRSRPST